MEWMMTYWPGALVLFLLAVFLLTRFQTVTLYEWETGLLYRDGRFVETLEPGRHRLWRAFGKLDLFRVQIEQASATGLVDASSAERLPFRLSAWFIYRVVDPRKYYEDSKVRGVSWSVASALVELAATLKLEELLASRSDANANLRALAAPILRHCELVDVVIDVVQLPPETRRMFVEVEKARLEGLAALERARGEHAALRALANAARLMKDNPELLNLRLLQSVAGAQKGGTTIVLGQGAFAGSGAAPGEAV